MIFKFKYKGKNIKLEVRECKNIFSKARGLMFRKKSKPLLFVFKNPTKQSIHSFFCRPFVAVWFYKAKIIDIKLVKPWKFFIKPRTKFDKLLEIPSNDPAFENFILNKIPKI